MRVCVCVSSHYALRLQSEWARLEDRVLILKYTHTHTLMVQSVASVISDPCFNSEVKKTSNVQDALIKAW